MSLNMAWIPCFPAQDSPRMWRLPGSWRASATHRLIATTISSRCCNCRGHLTDLGLEIGGVMGANDLFVKRLVTGDLRFQ